MAKRKKLSKRQRRKRKLILFIIEIIILILVAGVLFLYSSTTKNWMHPKSVKQMYLLRRRQLSMVIQPLHC